MRFRAQSLAWRRRDEETPRWRTRMQYSATCRRRRFLPLDFSSDTSVVVPSAGFDVSPILDALSQCAPVSQRAERHIASPHYRLLWILDSHAPPRSFSFFPSLSLSLSLFFSVPHVPPSLRSVSFLVLTQRMPCVWLFTVYEAPTNARGVAITVNCCRSVKERSTARKFRSADTDPRDRIFSRDKRPTEQTGG